MPKRVLLEAYKSKPLPNHVIDVSYPGMWGNPFIVGVHGTDKECVEMFENLMAGFLCTTQDNWIDQRISYFYMIKHLGLLAGKDLACVCPLDKPCHADVLLKLANSKRP